MLSEVMVGPIPFDADDRITPNLWVCLKDNYRLKVVPTDAPIGYRVLQCPECKRVYILPERRGGEVDRRTNG